MSIWSMNVSSYRCTPTLCLYRHITISLCANTVWTVRTSMFSFHWLLRRHPVSHTASLSSVSSWLFRCCCRPLGSNSSCQQLLRTHVMVWRRTLGSRAYKRASMHYLNKRPRCDISPGCIVFYCTALHGTAQVDSIMLRVVMGKYYLISRNGN